MTTRFIEHTTDMEGTFSDFKELSKLLSEQKLYCNP